MHRNWLIFLYCFGLTTLFAQTKHASQKLIYQITTDEYIELEKGAVLTENYLHTLVDSTYNQLSPFLRYGYYIKVYPQQEQLQMDVIAKTSISAILRMNKRDLMLVALDSMGRTITDATVFFKNKRIPFDKKTKTYRLKKWKEKEGRIMIKTKDEAIFYEVTKEGYRYDSYDKSFIYRLKSPIRLAKRIGWRVKEIIKYGEWFPYRTKEYKGYIALNQPKYRPNDTLKIKGFFTNKRGNPLKRPLNFVINSNGQQKLSKLVSPIEKGVYLLELPLVDTLNFTLDRPGNIFVYDERKWDSHQVKSHRFDYEAYQLDEVNYSLSTNQKTYEYGEKVIIKAMGKFKTGVYIPDGTIRLKLLTKYAQHNRVIPSIFWDKKVTIKKVLWETTLPLSSNQPTQILVPDSIFPKAALPIYAEAVFTNSNGEIQYKNVSFTIERPRIQRPLILNLEGEFITAKVGEETPVKNPTVEWFVYKKDGKVEGTKLVQLPYKERVNGHLYGYDISYPDSNYLVHLFLKDSLDQIRVSGKHLGNKINITCHNPRRLAITYQLFKGKTLIESTQSDQKLIRINRNASHKNYLLKYQYNWGGQLITKEKRFIYLKKELQIAIEQPTTIIPGEQVAIKIKVKNQKERAIKGVNLTAGAINGQFNSTSHFTPLNVPYKLSKNPKIFHHVALRPSTSFPKNALPITHKWAKKTKVDKRLFYKLRFPDAGVYLQYDTITKTDFHQNIAQFAPYLIKHGKAQPIYMIYCNKKLVYYYDIDDNPPYAFIGKEGYNSIQLRTLNYTYQIDSILLKKGQKLEFSIDVHHYAKHQTQLKIRKTPTSPLMTNLEKKILNQAIFGLRPHWGRHHLFQDSSNIHIFNHDNYRPKTVLKMGPFLPKKNLTFVLKDKFKNKFYFEPNFSYSLQKNRERLYEYFFLKNKELFPKKIALKSPQQIVYAPSDIVEKTPKDTHNIIIYHSLNRDLLKPSGRVQFQLQSSLRDNLIAILWKPQELAPYTLKPDLRTIQDWAGKYQLTFIKKDSTYGQLMVELVEKELLFLDLTALEFKPDKAGKIIQQISVKRSAISQQNLSTTAPKSKNSALISYRDVFVPTITGTITDESGEALIGASVLIKGTTTGTTTDIDGFYSLTVPNSDYTLVFSYTGYATQEIELGPNSAAVHVVLTEGLALDEIVVVGYGVKREKKALGYGVSVIASRGLAGKVAGVQISDNKKQKRLSLLNENLPATNQLRTSFKDNAFWQPNLVTDSNGEAYFTAVFPDNLTQWQTFVIGMDEKQRVGVSFANSNAFKPLVAQLAIPRFVMEGDEVDIIGKAINFTDDSLAVNTLFKVDGEITKTNIANIQDALIEKNRVKVTTKKDSITLNYQLKNGTYGDGEQRQIPVFPKGIIEHKGNFHLLETDTTLVLDFPDKSLPVTVRIEGNLRNLLMENVDYLICYPHGCNEQTASKLMALLLAKKIKKLQGLPFLQDDYIKKGIQRLDQAQNEEGWWGWWKGGRQNIWMTTYVLAALHEAEKVGFLSKSLSSGLLFLTNNLPNFQERDLLNTLELFVNIEQKGDFQQWVTNLDTSKNIVSLNEKLTLLKIKQANNLPHSLDTLYKYQQQDIFGNSFWGSPSYHWYNTDIQNSLLAYGILKRVKNKTLCRAIERYILRKVERNGWGNTFQTAKVLATFLTPNLNNDKENDLKNELTLISRDTQITPSFPFLQKLPNGASLQIRKKGIAPIYITTYQTFFNKNPQPKSDIFEVHSSLKQEDQTTPLLTATVPATLEVQLEVKRKAEYVMLEIPIPAGCSYGRKTQPVSWYRNGGKYQRNYEVHREYFKEKVAIYCRELPKGNYTYTINLEPRFSGNYTLNPAKAEEMYFPVFYGRNGMKRVAINFHPKR